MFAQFGYGRMELIWCKVNVLASLFLLSTLQSLQVGSGDFNFDVRQQLKSKVEFWLHPQLCLDHESEPFILSSVQISLKLDVTSKLHKVSLCVSQYLH